MKLSARKGWKAKGQGRDCGYKDRSFGSKFCSFSHCSVTVTNYACLLIKTKNNVVVPDNAIQACHYLPNNTILVRFWNRKEGTAWDHLTTEIKKGGKNEVGIFAIFQLTNKRNSLMFHLRSVKKTGKISKLFSNENGQLGL